MTDVVREFTRVLELEGQAIAACAKRYQNPEAGAELKRAVEFLRKSLESGGKIVVTGIGKSGKVAQKIVATMCSTGSLAVYLHPSEGLHGDLGVVTARDSVLALSYTGNTEELLSLLPSLKSLSVPVIGIGGNAQSRLGASCDAWLDGSVEQEACPHNLAPTSSTTLALAIGDALALALMQLRGFDQAAFAQNHPGGALGRKLSLRVADVMHTGEAVAAVAPEVKMDEVLLAMTRKPLGAALVVSPDGKLLGIVTEGDVRRALAHREKFFGLSASDVMTAKPVTVLPNSLAHTALELMENRKSQIYVLPIVDDRGHWKGLLRLHDLARLF